MVSKTKKTQAGSRKTQTGKTQIGKTQVGNGKTQIETRRSGIPLSHDTAIALHSLLFWILGTPGDVLSPRTSAELLLKLTELGLLRFVPAKVAEADQPVEPGMVMAYVFPNLFAVTDSALELQEKLLRRGLIPEEDYGGWPR